MSQEQLGNVSEIGQSGISRIEAGAQGFTSESLFRIASALEVEAHQLLDGGKTTAREQALADTLRRVAETLAVYEVTAPVSPAPAPEPAPGRAVAPRRFRRP